MVHRKRNYTKLENKKQRQYLKVHIQTGTEEQTQLEITLILGF